MDYAVVLYFDKMAENKFNHIIKSISQSGCNRYMLDTKIPPHITVSFFRTDNIVPVITALDENRENFTQGSIYWASLGTFTPYVLFAAPVLNEYLMNTCININKLVKQFADFGNDGHYLPYQWVPHTALAVKLNQEEIKIAFDTAIKHFSAFGGKANRLVLAECNPYKELKIWSLSE